MNQASSSKKSRRDDEGDRKRAAAAQHHRQHRDGDGDNNGCWFIGQEGQEVPMKMISANGADQLKNGDEEDSQLEGNVTVRERRS